MRTILSARSLRLTAMALAIPAGLALAGSLFSRQPESPMPAGFNAPAFLDAPVLLDQQDSNAAVSPGSQRAQMIKVLQSIDKRLASIETLLKKAQPKEGSDT